MAQYNIDRLLTIGRSALYYEDYVLSMQYFNQAITAKPYLYEPWYLRAVAKYNLDDYAGAEADCTQAIECNPYYISTYELRGLARIQQEKFTDAISDYDHALSINPDNRSLWHNRVLCHLQNKDYDRALLQLDTINARWSSYAPAYSIRADVYMQTADTTKAISALEKSLELDPYDGSTWAARSIISLQRREWTAAEQQLDHAIHLLPKNSNNYINRALARYNQNNLRGAMADYDAALDIEPNNFLGHYNRGLLRADVGDDNRAINDFDFVLQLEPDNMQALFNRAMLLDRTGDLRGAVRDYTKVLDEYPDFYTGILYRAQCYRRLGMTQKAELDEFKVYKTQLYQHLYGIQPKASKRSQRKRSDIDPDKYNQLVVADEQEPEREYQSEYRGRVQNRRAEAELLPMFTITPQPAAEAKNATPQLAATHFDATIEELNALQQGHKLHVSNTRVDGYYFALVDSLTAAIDRTQPLSAALPLILQRAAAHATLYDYESALADIATCLDEAPAAGTLSTPVTVAALWLRAVVGSSRTGDAATVRPQASNIDDIDAALRLTPGNAFLLFNRACLHAVSEDYEKAISDYTEAIAADAHLAEAYFNRGICHLRRGNTADAVSDLSKAGEMGIYSAYSIIKKQRK